MESSSTGVESVVIVGTGPAGLTAAIYAGRANLRPIVIEGEQPGGQLTITSEVENFPGFPSGVMGPELMDSFKKQAARFNTRFVQANVVKADLTKRPYTLELSNREKIIAHTVIIATGASAKWLGIPSEKKYLGKGVSACATCDGFFFRNMDIAVVGGGDTALEEATFLTRFAKSVTVIHRRDKLRASKVMQDKASHHPKIKFIWDTAVEDIMGDGAVSSLKLKNLKTGVLSDLSVQGLFIAIGHEPNTKVFREFLKCNEAGYIVTEPGSTKTQVPGVFAAGDVADPIYRQAVTAAGTGCMAAIDAERFLETVGNEE